MDSSDTISIRKYVALGLVGILVILAVITFFKAFETVGTGQIGVVTNYGRVTGRELGEGVSFISPWTEDVVKYDIKTQKVEATAPAATKDLQDVNATIVLNYQLNPGKVQEVHQRVGKHYQANVIDPQVQEAFKAVSAQYTASELITKRAEVKQAVLTNLRERVEKDNRYIIQDIAITNFSFSAEFNKAIEAVQIANQNIARAKQELETAKVEADKKIAEAEGAAKAQKLQQQTLSDKLLYKQWIEKWDGKLPTTVTGNGGTILNLPKK